MTDDNLPPLPQPEFDNLLDHIYEYGTLAEGTIPRARALCEAYARAAILAERERWQQDALRYRWLRDTNMSRPDMTDGSSVILAPYEVTAIWYGLPEDQWNLFGGCLQCSKGERFDAAIDAAMKGKA